MAISQDYAISSQNRIFDHRVQIFHPNLFIADPTAREASFGSELMVNEPHQEDFVVIYQLAVCLF
ncbi:MAG: hypothetical protein A4E44_00857 [Methanosaeta sp. PtaB.Bin018]|jgi:hypothetical protein|nr:MAG: hypothetical protein A4E44_00857 [Methanosaeta sp. PtaB.Bin018]OPY46544.1 MAG: hypothetical protein A4E46_00870 [Methanosaeta sp. PtaU1.Bin016]